jgi:hypothetical protein
LREEDCILDYYEKIPAPIDTLARRIGYRIRPAWIWSFKKPRNFPAWKIRRQKSQGGLVH